MAVLKVAVSEGQEFELFPQCESIPPGLVTESSILSFTFRSAGLDPYGVSLLVDGVALDPIASNPGEVRWKWSVGFHVGEAGVSLRREGHRRLDMKLRTDPLRAKLNRQQYTQMLGDLFEDTLALLALTGHRTGFRRGELEPPRIARLEFLLTKFDEVEKAIREIDAAPWRVLARRQQTVPTGRCSGATGRELLRAARRSDAVPADQWAGLPPRARALAERLGGRIPRAITRTVSKPDLRRREHSDMLRALLGWTSFLASVRASLRAKYPESKPPRVEGLLTRCAAVQRRALRLQELDLFADLQPSSGPLRPSHLYRRVGPYRRFFQAMRDYRAGLSEVDGDFLDLPLRRTYDLYEMWAFLRLLRAATHLGGGDGWKETFSDQLDGSKLVFNLRARPFDFGDFRLVFKPRYKEVWRVGGAQVGSFSREMEPDVAVEFEPVEGAPRPTVVLDAKYRVEGQVSAAIAGIHKYRDALVEVPPGGSLTDCERTVRAAFLITPHPFVGSDQPWREEDAPTVFFRKGYRDTFRFGALSLVPGVPLGRVRDLLTVALDAAHQD